MASGLRAEISAPQREAVDLGGAISTRPHKRGQGSSEIYHFGPEEGRVRVCEFCGSVRVVGCDGGVLRL
jgi:hypothetical protein